MKTRGKDLASFDKGRIIGFHQSGKTTREISTETDINVRTIQRIIAVGRKMENLVHLEQIVEGIKSRVTETEGF